MHEEERCCREAGASDDLQRSHRMDHEEQARDCGRAAAASDQIGAIEARRLCGETRQRQPDARRGAEERHREEQIEEEELPDLTRAPDDLERVELDPFRNQETSDRRRAERSGGARGGDGERLQKSVAQEGEQRSARAVSEERETDDEKREVVPFDDGEQPDQQNLVRQRGAGENGHGDEYGAGGPLMGAHLLRVSGTNTTGKSWPVVTRPSAFLRTSNKYCVVNGPPTGMIIVPPRFNCSISGGGM